MTVRENEIKYHNAIVEKSFSFAVRVVKSFKVFVKRDSLLLPLFKQLLRSGTSIGAKVSESQSASSRKDFIHKLQLSLKESLESEYWLKLLFKTEIINEKEFDSLFKDCNELTKTWSLPEIS